VFKLTRLSELLLRLALRVGGLLLFRRNDDAELARDGAFSDGVRDGALLFRRDNELARDGARELRRDELFREEFAELDSAFDSAFDSAELARDGARDPKADMIRDDSDGALDDLEALLALRYTDDAGDPASMEFMPLLAPEGADAALLLAREKLRMLVPVKKLLERCADGVRDKLRTLAPWLEPAARGKLAVLARWAEAALGRGALEELRPLTPLLLAVVAREFALAPNALMLVPKLLFSGAGLFALMALVARPFPVVP
jgi:hypothetical protein